MKFLGAAFVLCAWGFVGNMDYMQEVITEKRYCHQVSLHVISDFRGLYRKGDCQKWGYKTSLTSGMNKKTGTN